MESGKLSLGDTEMKAFDLAELASEFWCLLRNYDLLIGTAPENKKPGLAAQAKYGARRLEAVLERAGMHIETFDGQSFSSNLPIVAVNADDFADGSSAFIEYTLEPTIIAGTTPIRTGKVYLNADKP